MGSVDGTGLAESLRRLRLAAGMTQEGLAERAGISARTVSDAERGLRVAVHGDTAQRLAAALGLFGEQSREFQAIARGQVPPSARVSDHLPAVPTPLLGRAQEVEQVTTTLGRADVRLLTLTGTGGIGKTRLAIEAARAARDAYPGGTYFASLGELRSAALVAPELAKAIGAVESGAALEDVMTARLSGLPSLIVLDTFEHVTAAAPVVYALLLRCPSTTFLVTSRNALRLRGEHEYPVPPLDSPPSLGDDPTATLMRWPATALFCERARAVRPDLLLDSWSAAIVVDICKRLDGVPLAIELAAARVKHLPLAAVHAQLEHALELLAGGALDLPARHRAIRDTVAWSHDLLDATAQVLLRRLSVFSGGWTLDAIDGVCGSADEVGEPLDGMSSLVDQSLIVLDPRGPDARYDMLDVIRQFAGRRLVEAGEHEVVARRHAMQYLELAERAESQLVRHDLGRWLRLLETERGNMRAGIAWAIEHGETVAALRFIVALWRYWRHLGEFVEGRRWCDAALALPGQAPASLRAKALWAAAALALPQGDDARMGVLAAEALHLAAQSSDPMDQRNALTMDGMLALMQARYAEALQPLRTAVAICEHMGMSWHLGTSYLNLGIALLQAGAAPEANTILGEALRVYRTLGDEVFAARVINSLAHAALARDDVAEADELARTGLSMAARKGEREGVASGLLTLAAVAAVRSRAELAAQLAGASAAVRESIAARPGPFEMAIPGRLLQRIEAATSPQHWRRSWDAGRALDMESAIARGLA